MIKARLDGRFNEEAELPYSLRLEDFRIAMLDVYDFFFDVNQLLLARGLHRMDDMLRPAAMSGMVSDMLTASLARHSRTLTENRHFNGHPDLIVQGRYANSAVKAGTEGVEIKSTRKKGGAVDTHGAREQFMCVFVYETDHATEPAQDRRPMRFSEVYLAHVTEETSGETPAVNWVPGRRRCTAKVSASSAGTGSILRRRPETRQLGHGFDRQLQVGFITFDADAAISDRVRGSECGPRAGEGIEHNAFA